MNLISFEQNARWAAKYQSPQDPRHQIRVGSDVDGFRELRSLSGDLLLSDGGDIWMRSPIAIRALLTFPVVVIHDANTGSAKAALASAKYTCVYGATENPHVVSAAVLSDTAASIIEAATQWCATHPATNVIEIKP